jgi:tetratricopeptide (TPR) repeat protein
MWGICNWTYDQFLKFEPLITMNRKIFISSISCLLVIFALGCNSHKNVFGPPAYLHALSDLRAARWMLEHRPGDWARTEDEVEAVKQIDAAITELKNAAIDDGKDINDHPKVDEKSEHMGRLHDAIEFLKKARANIFQEEYNEKAEGLRDRAYRHIDEAINATQKAIKQ